MSIAALITLVCLLLSGSTVFAQAATAPTSDWQRIFDHSDAQGIIVILDERGDMLQQRVLN